MRPRETTANQWKNSVPNYLPADTGIFLDFNFVNVFRGGCSVLPLSYNCLAPETKVSWINQNFSCIYTWTLGHFSCIMFLSPTFHLMLISECALFSCPLHMFIHKELAVGEIVWSRSIPFCETEIAGFHMNGPCEISAPSPLSSGAATRPGASLGAT